MEEWSKIQSKMSKEDQRQKLYNHIGVLLVIGIIGGSGLLLMKYSDEQKEPIKITEPTKEEQVKGAATAQVSAKINVNTATLEELDKLKGIGPATAQKIIDYRTQNGLFKTIDELNNVSGIGDAKLDGMRDSITL